MARDRGDRTGQRGRLIEERACALLLAEGLEALQRNYRCRGGEVDLIMRDGASIVFVEVRYRASEAFGGAIESIGVRKRQRLRHCARVYLATMGFCSEQRCRFDVVLATGPVRDASLRWIRGAFD